MAYLWKMYKGYCDVDWGGHKHRHLISGYSFHFGCGAVSWSSKKRHIIALSSTGAEYITYGYKILSRKSRDPKLNLWKSIVTIRELLCFPKTINSTHIQSISTCDIILFTKLWKMKRLWSVMSLWSKCVGYPNQSTYKTKIPMVCWNIGIEGDNEVVAAMSTGTTGWHWNWREENHQRCAMVEPEHIDKVVVVGKKEGEEDGSFLWAPMVTHPWKIWLNKIGMHT